jgi:hypothetical protein
MNDIHDIKPAVAMGMDWRGWPWAVAALAIIVAALLAWRWWRRRRKQSDAPLPEPLPSPEAEALALLDQLTAEALTNEKLFYFRLSAILRRYVERRFEFSAAEMTLEELLPCLGRLPLPREVVQPLIDFCRRAEPIKFAGAAADPGRAREDLALARAFVHGATPAATAPASPVEGSEPRWASRILGAKAAQPSNGRQIEAPGQRATEKPNP